MHILLYLATSQRDLPLNATWYPVLSFPHHFLSLFHHYLHNKVCVCVCVCVYKKNTKKTPSKDEDMNHRGMWNWPQLSPNIMAEGLISHFFFIFYCWNKSVTAWACLVKVLLVFHNNFLVDLFQIVCTS